MMSTNRAEEQIAIALEYVQSKRRLEHIASKRQMRLLPNLSKLTS